MTRAVRNGLSGVIVAGLGRLAAAERLPRNVFAGIRIPSTMRSDEAWLAGHRAAASALTAAGLGQIGLAAVIAVKRPGHEAERVLSRVGTAWVLALLGVATVQASRAARAIEAA